MTNCQDHQGRWIRQPPILMTSNSLGEWISHLAFLRDFPSWTDHETAEAAELAGQLLDDRETS